MKKVLFTLLVTIVSIVQSASAQTWLGIEGGLISSDYFGKTGGETIYSLSKWGGRAGLSLDGQVFKHFFLQPSLLYVMNGYKQKTVKGELDFTLNCIEIPFNIVYKVGLKNESRVFLGVGPYMALNLFGDKQYSNLTIPGDPSGQINVGTDERDDIRPFDVGINLCAGNQFKNGFFVKFYYQTGFSNMSVAGGDDNVLKSKNSGVVIGYYFKNKKEKQKHYSNFDYNNNGVGL